jgi:starch synthase (maltosyl-transferring)
VGGLRVAERKKRWHLILDRLTARLATGSVCVSQGVFRFSRDVAGLNPDRLTIIPNGIDPVLFCRAARLSRAEIGVPESAHLGLYVGRLDVQKGLPDLLDAAEQVAKERPLWHLTLAGDGPLRDWLISQLTHRYWLRERVHWLGSRDDIPALLKSADVLIHPSLWEGMPNAVLEAMAASRPVIGTAVEGTEDLIVPGQTGWLVPPGNVLALTDAIRDAADSPERCLRYGEAGCRLVESEFSLKGTLAAYERLWARILGFEVPNTNADPAGTL